MPHELAELAPQLRERELRTMIAILSHADSDHGRLYVSNRTLADEVGLSVRTVAFALQGLEEAGLIARRGKYKNRSIMVCGLAQPCVAQVREETRANGGADPRNPGLRKQAQRRVAREREREKQKREPAAEVPPRVAEESPLPGAGGPRSSPAWAKLRQQLLTQEVTSGAK